MSDQQNPLNEHSPFNSAENSFSNSIDSFRSANMRDSNMDLSKQSSVQHHQPHAAMSDFSDDPCVQAIQTSTSAHSLSKLVKSLSSVDFAANAACEFQSLPPNIALPTMVHNVQDLEKEYLRAQSAQQLSPSKTAPTIQKFIENTVTNVFESLTTKSQFSPTTKTAGELNKSTSSNLSLIDDILNKTHEKNSSKCVVPVESAAAAAAAASAATAATLRNFSNVLGTSSSSPNPEHSPYKLVSQSASQSNLIRSPSQQSSTQNSLPTLRQQQNTLSPNGSTINDAVAIFNAVSTQSTDNSMKKEDLIESLIARKDLDPILSCPNKQQQQQHEQQQQAQQNLKPLTTSPSVCANLSGNSQRDNLKSQSMSPSKSTSALAALAKLQSSIPPIPDSSQEFFNSLNANLAAAAVVSSLMDHEQPSVASKQEEEKVDKAVIEKQAMAENKPLKEEKKQVEQRAREKLDTSTKKDAKENNKENKKHNQQHQQKAEKKIEQPKQQRERHAYTRNSNQNKSSNNSQNQSKLSNKSTSANNSTINTSQSSEKQLKKQHQQQSKHHKAQQQDKLKKLKYDREFLLKIRDERSKFIETIMPDIFKAYCYCMTSNGLWDPEQYFDIVQFAGDYDKVKANSKQQNHYNHHHQHSNNQYKNKRFSHKHAKASPPRTGLQVPKNSPKTIEPAQSTNSNNILSSIFTKTKPVEQNPDKVLLNLLKKNESQVKQETDIMSLFNKQSSSAVQKPANVFDTLFSDQSKNVHSTTQHQPVVLTAQELEQLQLNIQYRQQQQHQQKSNISSCTSSYSSANSSPEERAQNVTNAYKQLLQNIYPSTPSSSPLDTVLSKLSQNKQTAIREEESSSVLKKLLNINNHQTEQNQEPQVSNRLMAKVMQNRQEEKQHFDSILSKLMPVQQQQQNDILKWFKC